MGPPNVDKEKAQGNAGKSAKRGIKNAFRVSTFGGGALYFATLYGALAVPVVSSPRFGHEVQSFQVDA